MDYTNPEDKKSANELSNEELHEMVEYPTYKPFFFSPNHILHS